jgi:hypothetical protein
MNEWFAGMKIPHHGQGCSDNSFTIPLLEPDTGGAWQVLNIFMKRNFSNGIQLQPWRLL